MIEEYLQQYINKCNDFAAGKITAEEWREYCKNIYESIEEDIINKNLQLENNKIYGNV